MTPVPVILAAARGNTVGFEESFWEDPSLQTIPIITVDNATYPAVLIRSPDGQRVREGVALPLTPGTWRYEFAVPPTAMLSSPGAKWAIEWTVETVSGRTIQVTRYFEVVELRVGTPPERDLGIITRPDLPAHVEYRTDLDLFAISAELRCYPGGGVPLATFLYNAQDPGASTILRDVKGDDRIYSFDTTALPIGEYIVFFTIQEVEGSPLLGQDRMIRVAPPIVHFMFPSLRSLIDRLNKRRNWLQSYVTWDLYEYLLQGIDVLNAIFPTTSMGLVDAPLGAGGLRQALYCAAALHAMDAQLVMAVETDFDFGGQKVPLRVDRRSGYQAAIDRMEKRLDDFRKSKLGLFRQFNKIGSSSVRMVQRRYQNMVVPISSGAGADTMSLLSGLGLL